MDNWFNENSKNFTVDMNGYSKAPYGAYLSTLSLIDRGGKIVDLGSGNGMLLKFLMEFSGKNLIPYGIDVNKRAIKKAKSLISEYSANFQITPLQDFQYDNAPYDIIITNPFYSKQTMSFSNMLKTKLSPNGKIIYRLHNDVLERNSINSVNRLQNFIGNDFNISRGNGLWFATFTMS